MTYTFWQHNMLPKLVSIITVTYTYHYQIRTSIHFPSPEINLGLTTPSKTMLVVSARWCGSRRASSLLLVCLFLSSQFVEDNCLFHLVEFISIMFVLILLILLADGAEINRPQYELSVEWKMKGNIERVRLLLLVEAISRDYRRKNGRSHSCCLPRSIEGNIPLIQA